MPALVKSDSTRSSDDASMDSFLLYNIDRLSYAKALELQLGLHAQCAAGEIPGALVLLEHNPVITMGVKTGKGNILASSDLLMREGIELVETDRGGDVTYHGPGQLVGYPIVPLRRMGLDLHGYLRALEQSIIDALAEFGLKAGRNGPAGVWVGDRKVCSIGVAVRRWVTYHGFALNVAPNMKHFGYINPCGLAAAQVTCLRDLLSDVPDVDAVRAACARSFEYTFHVDLAGGGI